MLKVSIKSINKCKVNYTMMVLQLSRGMVKGPTFKFVFPFSSNKASPKHL